MKRFYLVLMLITIGALSFSQGNNASENWTGHFSFNHIVDLKAYGGKLFAASENVVFLYDYSTGNYDTITTIDGLSGENISSLHYSPTNESLFIGYQSGLIEIYSLSEHEVLKVVDILNKVTIPPENKTINHFLEHQNQLYVSTNYGISLYDLDHFEFGDTYFIGSGGSQVEVRETQIFDGAIYAATNVGLISADLNNQNLIDFQFWNILSNGNFNNIEIFSDKLYCSSGTSLYEVVGSTTTLSTNFQSPILDLTTSQNHLAVTTPNLVYKFLPDLTIESTYSLDDPFETSFTTSCFANDFIFLGTQDFGVLQPTIAASNNYEEIHPSGPIKNSAFALHYSYNNLWVTFGDYSFSFNPSPLRSYGFSNLENEVWNNISYDSIYSATQKPVHNLNAIATNPINSNQVFMSSFQNGILNLKKNTSIELLDQTNSGLESLILPGSPNYKSLRVSDLKFDSQGQLWSITSLISAPLKKYDPNTNQWQSFSFSTLIEDPLNDELGFGTLEFGNDGTKWIGSYRNGVIAFNDNGNRIGKIQGEDLANLPSDHISALAMDKNNVLWIGTHKGLRLLYNTTNFFNAELLTTDPIIILEEGLPRELLELQFITEIIVDGANNKWISTVDAGVFYLSADGQNTIYHFTKDNSPLPSNSVNCMAHNKDDGILYFGTSRGLVSFKAGGSAPSLSLDDAFVYPNPVRPDFDLMLKKIKIKNLSDNVNIKITDIEGNLVAEAQSRTNLRFKGYNLEIDGGTAYWNGNNFANTPVASGVYTVLISDLDNLETRVLKIMLIRS